MKHLFLGLMMPIFIVLVCTSCADSPARVGANPQVMRPTQVTDFNVLYGENCAGCHGSQGKGGAAIPLSDPVFLTIADDATIRRIVTNGVPVTPMPAFAQSAGGMLTDKQVDAIVTGIRTRWANPDLLRDANPPPYLAQAAGDPVHGAAAYATYFFPEPCKRRTSMSATTRPDDEKVLTPTETGMTRRAMLFQLGFPFNGCAP